MTTAPFFSIVIPVYNRAPLVGKVLQSFLDQTFSDFEIIVIDDGSTDATQDILKGWNDSRIRVHRTENRERGAARNAGAVRASGAYVNFFDSDDIAYPHHLATAHAFACRHEPDFFHVGYHHLSPTGKIIGQETDFSYSVADRLIFTNFLGCDSVFLRRSVALENPFEEDRRLASSEDWELWLRIISRYPLQSCSEITFAMVNHPERSLFTISPDRILERDHLLMELLFADRLFVERFSKNLPLFTADRYTFFALTLSLVPNRKSDALSNLWRAVRSTPLVLLRKRFWASLRHIIRQSFSSSKG